MNKVVSPVDIEGRQKLDLRSGDTVRVWQKIVEKGKTRLQAFEGLVLAGKHGKEAGATFTVRRVASGVGVEKIFPLYSPIIDKIEVLKRSKVRRSKLYHIRDKAAKEIRRQMRNVRMAKEVEATPAPETTPAEKSISQMTTAEVTAKIAEITQLIAQLQTQLIQMLGGSAMSGISGVLPEINLKTGSTGEAVKLLQTWLAKDAEIYPEGIISGYFGPLTKTAVIRFQEKYKAEVLDPWNFTNGTGIVGPTTRAKLSELFGSQ